MGESVRVREIVLKEILAQARREPQIECCGMLAGRDGVITEIYPATNALASATAYEIAPRELFEMFRDLRKKGLTHLGQYHSHLSTENTPSPTDIEYAGYPEQAYFIITLLAEAPNPIRAFSIRDGRACPLEIVGAGIKQ